MYPTLRDISAKQMNIISSMGQLSVQQAVCYIIKRLLTRQGIERPRICQDYVGDGIGVGSFRGNNRTAAQNVLKCPVGLEKSQPSHG